jgi:uncharacterized protein (TIGR02246 family)
MTASRQSLALLMLGILGGALLVFGLLNRNDIRAQANKDDKAKTEDEAAVHKTLEAFVLAFNENDAKKMAASLSKTAEYIDESSNRLEGSVAIGEMLANYFSANPGAKLQITPQGARTVSPGVVLEDVESTITVVEKKSQSVRQVSLVYAKVGDQWQIASIREFPEEVQVVSPEERLKELDWLVGDWVDEGGDSLVSNSIHFSADRTHLIRDFTVKQEGDELLKGMQWIGIDPLTGNIKAWSFDNNGGRSESLWTKNGAEWLIRSTGITSDGDESGATYIVKPLGKDRIEVKAMHKVIGNVVEADSTSILVRKAALPKK